MKSLLLWLTLLTAILFVGGCNQVSYTSITRPTIDNNRDYHYIVSEREKRLEGNSSVRDINNKSSKYDIIIIENDGSYYYTY